jgi:hypothetical protein
MARYLVERYLPALDNHGLANDVARLQAASDGEARLVLTLYSPDDEVCFHLFDASTGACVEDTGRNAGLLLDRILPVFELGHGEEA